MSHLRGIVLANLALFAVALLRPSQPAWLLLAGALCALAVAVEVAAPHVQRAGFLSLAGGLYLAMGMLPQVGVAVAALASLVGLSIRSVTRGSRDPVTRWAELLPDSLAAAGGLALIRLVGVGQPQSVLFLAGLLGYATGTAAGVATSAGVSDRRINAVRSVQMLAVWALAGTTLGGLDSPLAAGAGLPLLGLAYLLAPRLGQAHHVAELIEREQRLAQRTVESIAERMDLLLQSHQQRTLEREIFTNFARAFAQDPGTDATHETIRQQATRAVKPDSLALFVPVEGRLLPVAAHHPAVLSRLRQKAGAGQSEPVVEECFRRRRQLRKKPGQGRSGLFSPTEYALALPLGNQGALYLGWAKPPVLGSDELEALLTLSELAGIALATGQELAQVERELVYQTAGHAEARDWIERFDILLGAVRSLAGQLSTDEVLDTLRQLAGHLVRHERGAIVVRLQEGERVVAWPEPLARDSLHAYVQTALAHGRPLLGPPAGATPVWEASMVTLAVPIMADDSALGAIVLGRSGDGFSTQEQESLSLGAVQMAMMLEKARLFEEVVESRRRLQESQAQLITSSKLAAVGQLAAGVAHELNTPLGAVMLRLESANRSLSKGDPEAARKKLEVAENALLAARDIVSKLLAYSHDQPRDPVEAPLAEVMAQAAALVDGQLNKQQVELVCEAVPDCCVRGNPNELSQVLINLILNGRDAILSACPHGQVTVRTRVDTREIRIEVEDSGPGIPEAIRDRIFDPFFTTKPVGVGTGLGLSVSRQIVAAHQGELRLLDGHPTRFAITLPRV